MLKINPLYLYGSENPKARNKVHLCMDNGEVLCKRKVQFGEATAVIKKLDGDVMHTEPFVDNSKMLGGPTEVWKFNKCLACEKIYNSLPLVTPNK